MSTIDLVNTFYSISLSKDDHQQCAFSWQDWRGGLDTFILLPESYNNSPALLNKLVPRDLDHLFLPCSIILVHYIDAFMLIGPSDQEVESTLDLLRHLCFRQ